MFKKFKDKLTEEMKSSPNRLQQLAQAAQAVVTSASSSISDISNNDLFTIADEGPETPQKLPSGFQDISLSHSPSPSRNAKQEGGDTLTPLANDHYPGGSPPSSNFGIYPNPRTRKLSNSSMSSDVSFRLPTYESPGGMFHLQSDLDVSASELEDNVNVPAQLERVSKEHLYAAYRRTNEKYNKYRGRYTDLARHYRNLERENAKAKAVLVETQDKALRRISELREQCQLEQSAKAHLENELRIELDERNLKIESLNTKIKLLQTFDSNHIDVGASNDVPAKDASNSVPEKQTVNSSEQSVSLIDLSSEEKSPVVFDNAEEQNAHSKDVQSLNNKIQKLEQLLVKCKETIKTHKEKNVQLNSELQIVSSELDRTKNDNEKLKTSVQSFDSVTKQLEDSKLNIKSLQDELNSFETKKTSEISVFQSQLATAKSKISELNENILMLKRHEEENVISLAENKLTIHKELEGKENEIKKLKKSIATFELDLKGKDIQISELKNQIHSSEEEKSTLNKKINELNSMKSQNAELNQKISTLSKKRDEAEAKYSSTLEKLKCTEMQFKQETDEKLALNDRNCFLEGRIKQLSSENATNSKKIADMEQEIASQTEQKKTHNEYKEVVDSYNELKTNFEEMSTKANTFEIENKELSLSIKKLEDRLSDLQINYDALSKNNSDLSEEKEKSNTENQIKMTEYTSKIEKLEEKLLGMSDDSKRQGLIDELQKDFEMKLTVAKDSLEKTIEKKTAEYNSLSSSYKELQDRYENKLIAADDSLKSAIEEKTTEYNKLKKAYEELQDRYESNLKSVNSSEEESIKRCEELSNEKSNLLREIEELQKANSVLKKDVDNAIAASGALEKSLASVEAENKNYNMILTEMKEETSKLHNEINTLQETLSQSISEISDKNKVIAELENQIRNTREDYENNLNSLNDEVQKLMNTNKILESENKLLSESKNSLSQELSDVKKNLTDNDKKLNEYSENNEVWQQKLSNILDDNNYLQEKCTKLKQEKESNIEHISNLEEKISEFDAMKAQLEEYKLEKEFLNMRIAQLDSDTKSLSGEKNELILKNNDLELKQSKMNSDSNKHSAENEGLKERETALRNEVQKLEMENNGLKSNINGVIKEKDNIATQLEEIQSKIKELETALDEKREFENKYLHLLEQQNTLENECTSVKSKYEQLSNSLSFKNSEFEDLYNKYGNVKMENDNMAVRIKVLEKLETEHLSEIESLQSLREENSKLASSIEGLQTHLMTVSKENGSLNDQIRNFQANDEVMQVSNKKNLESIRHPETSEDSTANAELVSLREENVYLLEQVKAAENINTKLLDLERQNSILIEEKLELEDQLRSSMPFKASNSKDHRSDTETDLNTVKTKMDDIVNEKLDLESRLANLELINRSSDNNIRLLEQKNEKLGLTNEKLERRLDEALVSLNHIRNLEENTELEYLRNILYEYLTGPTNNNLILAKVLSAVVKFDHRQTQLVLEREKEKQGLLGQLGLL